jgi:hypothetical protein
MSWQVYHITILCLLTCESEDGELSTLLRSRVMKGCTARGPSLCHDLLPWCKWRELWVGRVRLGFRLKTNQAQFQGQSGCKLKRTSTPLGQGAVAAFPLSNQMVAHFQTPPIKFFRSGNSKGPR